MKNPVIISILTVTLLACQEKQYFTSSPEIDLIKRQQEAYLKGDWATLRSFYHDTATIYANTWGHGKLSPDQLTERQRKGVEDYSEYALAKDGVYELLINDRGEYWVHNWTEWRGVHKNGKEVRVVVNISFRVANNKIVFAGFIYDTLPLVMAAQSGTQSSM
ncbi:hypothetical protein QQ054_29485 [Oscillatoria amoena NRMC-F 0135]|nr:hypothetical protein [Oscillatoria amoena NRMC-F 0135]